VNDADAQGGCELVLALCGEGADAFRLLQYALRLFRDGAADGSEGDLALAALEDFQPEFLFQFLDRQRQRGLADEGFFRRAAKVAFLRDGDDEAQFVQGHDALLAAVIPAKAGIQRSYPICGWFCPASQDLSVQLDPGLRRDDEVCDLHNKSHRSE